MQEKDLTKAVADRVMKRKKTWIVISSLLLIISLVYVVFFRAWIFVDPFKPFALESVICSATDKDGNLIIVDSASKRLLKVSGEGKLLWQQQASDKTFSDANSICVDDEGSIYILDVRAYQGVRKGSERIVKFSSDGKYIATLKNWNYRDPRNFEMDRFRASVVGMTGSSNSLYYIRKIKDSIYVSDEMNAKAISFDFPYVENTVLSATFDREKEELYYSTYNGMIYKYVDGVNDELLYDSDDVDGSIIRNVSYGNGKLYSNDIGLRNILVMDTETYEESVLAAEDPDLGGVDEISNSVFAQYSPVSATSYSVLTWNADGSYDCFYEFELSDNIKLITIIMWIMLGVLALGVLLNLFIFIVFLVKKASMYMRIIIAIAVGVFGMAGLFLGSVYPKFKLQFQNEVFSRENLAAVVTADRIPKDAFLNLTKPSDYMNDDYMAVKEAVESVFLADTEDAKDMYCSLYRVIDGTITLTYTLEGVCVVYPYDWDYEGSDEQTVLEEGKNMTCSEISSSGSYIYVLAPMYDDDGNAVGLIEVGKDLEGFVSETEDILRTLIINIFAMTIVVIMFVIEIFYYVAAKRQYEENASENKGEKKAVPAGLLRFVTFLVSFIINLTAALVPIYAMRIAGKGVTFGLSPEVLSAIPISVEVIAGAICSAFGNRVIKKLGGRKTAVLSSIFMVIGIALRAIPNIWVVALSAIFLGAGWGMLVIMINVLITDLPEDQRHTGFAYYSAAGFSGTNCGVLFGGFLIQWVNFPVLFLISAALGFILVFVTAKYLANLSTDDIEEEEGEGSKMSPLKLIFNPNMIIFIFMMLIPASIVAYYLNYMYPIIGEEWGLTETYIGYSYLIDGFFVVLFGGVLTKAFSKKKRLGLAISSIIYALAFVVVIVFQNIPGLLISLALVGISDGFGNPLMTGYFTELDEVVEYGYDRAFGIYSIFENVASSIGSFVFSYVLILGVKSGLTVVAGMLILLSIIFLVFGIFDRKKTKKVNVEESGV